VPVCFDHPRRGTVLSKVLKIPLFPPTFDFSSEEASGIATASELFRLARLVRVVPDRIEAAAKSAHIHRSVDP